MSTCRPAPCGSKGTPRDEDANRSVAASAVSATPVRDSFAGSIVRRAELQEATTKEEWFSLLPGNCQESCKGSAWEADAFWAEANCMTDPEGTPCQKVLCDTLQQTTDCAKCLTIEGLKQMGRTLTEEELKQYEESNKEVVKQEEEICKKLDKRDFLGAFHARSLITRATDKEIEDWQNELKAQIDPKCVDICKTTVFSGRPWIDACHKGEIKDCSKFTCARIDQMTDCSFCIAETEYKAAGLDDAVLQQEREKYHNEAKNQCQAEGFEVNTA